MRGNDETLASKRERTKKQQMSVCKTRTCSPVHAVTSKQFKNEFSKNRAKCSKVYRPQHCRLSGGRFKQRSRKRSQKFTPHGGNEARGTGSARNERGVKNQRSTDRIPDDLMMSDSPSSLHSSFLQLAS